MTVYTFSFPANMHGLPVTVHDSFGNAVTIGKLFATDGDAMCSFDLATGVYTAKAGGIDVASVPEIADDATVASSGGVKRPAAWFTMTATIPDATPAVRTAVNFHVIDDGRAPATDLFIIDPEDDTTLIAQASGEYLVFVTIAASAGQPATTAGLAHLIANVAINGDNEAPAYYFENGNFFWVSDGVDQIPMATSFTFHQTIVAGDTIQTKVRISAQTAVMPGIESWNVLGAAIGLTKLGVDA